MLTAWPTLASKPVESTLTGCVMDGAFYATQKTIAYRMAPKGVDLAPLEGKSVRMKGWLSPGDAFELGQGERPVVLAATCSQNDRHLILHEQVIRLRVDATHAVQANDLESATKLMAAAMALDPPPECDTFTDRAKLLMAKDDVEGALKDVAVITARKCRGAQLNYLLLQDLAALLTPKHQPQARQLLQLALKMCDGGELCLEALKKDLKALGP